MKKLWCKILTKFNFYLVQSKENESQQLLHANEQVLVEPTYIELTHSNDMLVQDEVTYAKEYNLKKIYLKAYEAGDIDAFFFLRNMGAHIDI
jgi:hypothetical protein